MCAAPAHELQAVFPVRTQSTVLRRSNFTLALLQPALPHKSRAAIAKYFSDHKTELESPQETDEGRGSGSEAEVSQIVLL